MRSMPWTEALVESRSEPLECQQTLCMLLERHHLVEGSMPSQQVEIELACLSIYVQARHVWGREGRVQGASRAVCSAGCSAQLSSALHVQEPKASNSWRCFDARGIFPTVACLP